MGHFFKAVCIILLLYIVLDPVNGTTTTRKRPRPSPVPHVPLPVKTTDCRWNYDVVFPSGTYPPLILDEASKNIVLPELDNNNQRISKVATGQALIISCPLGADKNGNTQPNYLQIKGQPFSIEVTCAQVQSPMGLIHIFQDNNQNSYEMIDMRCFREIKSTFKLIGNACATYDGYTDGKVSYIGFDTRWKGYFYPQIKVCFNEKEEKTLFTEHTLHGKNIRARIKIPDKPRFKYGNVVFFEEISVTNMETIWSKKAQIAYFKNINPTLIDDHTNYFSKGHLSPDADFVTNAEEIATYFFINAMPQWQPYNNGKWFSIEEQIRKEAARKGTEVTIYTGGAGRLTNNGQPITFLKGRQPYIPFDAFTWKIVYVENPARAIAIVISNNPTMTVISNNIPQTVPVFTATRNPCNNNICGKTTSLWYDNFRGTGAHVCCEVKNLMLPNDLKKNMKRNFDNVALLGDF